MRISLWIVYLINCILKNLALIYTVKILLAGGERKEPLFWMGFSVCFQIHDVLIGKKSVYFFFIKPFSFHIWLTSINSKAVSFKLSTPTVHLEMTHSQFYCHVLLAERPFGVGREKSHTFCIPISSGSESLKISQVKNMDVSHTESTLHFSGSKNIRKTHSSDVSSCWEVATSKISVWSVES